MPPKVESKNISVLQNFFTRYLKYVTYYNPRTNSPTTALSVLVVASVKL